MDKTEHFDGVVNAVKQALEACGWTYYVFDEESMLFRFDLSIETRISRISYQVELRDYGDGLEDLVIYGICPVSADCEDAGMTAQLAEFLHRVNYGVPNGCFEMDYTDGEIRYKSYISIMDHVPSAAVVKNSLLWVSSMFERFGPGIADIVFAGCSAREAVEKCMQTLEDETGEVFDLENIH